METTSQRVLIVDDERAFLRGISAWLKSKGSVQVVTAINGAEAVDRLHTMEIDLVITDLQMPIMDGFALLAHMSRLHPSIPVMVMTAYASPTALERLKQVGTVTCLEKPLDLDDFAVKVRAILAGQARGFLQGISLTSILQLLEMERKTAALKVFCGDLRGTMFFLDGRLIDAETVDREDGRSKAKLRGDDAAMEIISWDEAAVEIDPGRRSPQKSVAAGLNFLLMEALRRKDEGRLPQGGTAPSKPARGSSSWEPAANPPGAVAELTESIFTPLPEHIFTPLPEPLVPSMAQRETIEACLTGLGEIDGVSAVAVMNAGGKLIASYAKDERPHLEEEAVAFNDIAKRAHETASELSLDGCSELTMGTGRNLVLVQGPEVEGEIIFRVVAILKWDCNQSALASRFGEIVPELMKVLSASGE